jgi:hypothetical protein
MVYHLDADNHVRGLLLRKSGERMPFKSYFWQSISSLDFVADPTTAKEAADEQIDLFLQQFDLLTLPLILDIYSQNCSAETFSNRAEVRVR